MQSQAELQRSFAAKGAAQDDKFLLTCRMGSRPARRARSSDVAEPLPFRLTSGIIRVCLDLTGLFRNKDIRPVLMIRLARRGARKQPHYRIVVIEKERARNGRPVEVVGTYNPRTNPASVELKRDRVEYWVSKGAQMSDRVNKLFSKTPAPATAGSAA
jgi:small subunit ribosomal protein S16